MKRKRALSLLLSAAMILVCTSCTTGTGGQKEQSETVSFSVFDPDLSQGIVELPPVEQIKKGPAPVPKSTEENMKVYRADETAVRFFGRTYQNGDIRMMTWTASGFDLLFTGTKLEISFFATKVNDDINRPMIGVFLDNYNDPEKMIVVPVDKAMEYITVLDGLEDTTHYVKIFKMSENNTAPLGVMDIRTDGQLEGAPEALFDRRIEFIGDSITSGFGILAPKADSAFKTSEENGAMTYAALTARNLNAEYNVLSISGWALYKSWAAQGSAYLDIPPIYRYTDYTYQKEMLWDFSAFQPHAVVVNLGTNDSAYLKDHPDEYADFVKAGADFFRDIRTKNPDAAIVVCYGMMGLEMTDYLKQAVEKSGLENIHYIGLRNLRTARALHPSPADHQANAELLTAELRKILNW